MRRFAVLATLLILALGTIGTPATAFSSPYSKVTHSAITVTSCKFATTTDSNLEDASWIAKVFWKNWQRVRTSLTTVVDCSGRMTVSVEGGGGAPGMREVVATLDGDDQDETSTCTYVAQPFGGSCTVTFSTGWKIYRVFDGELSSRIIEPCTVVRGTNTAVPNLGFFAGPILLNPCKQVTATQDSIANLMVGTPLNLV